MLDKRSADRGLMSVPFLRLQVRVNIIREKDPFDELVCLHRATRWYQQIDVQLLIVLDATAKAPIHANHMHELIVSNLRHGTSNGGAE